MRSFKNFVKVDLLNKLLIDVKDRRIFNEADLQYRAAFHLDKEYFPHLYLTNQPNISIGTGRGTTPAKPDIVIYHDPEGPRIALELKCFLKYDNASLNSVIKSVWRDVDKLHRFKSRYKNSKNAFALVFVDMDKVDFQELRSEFSRATREGWMSRYLFIHVVNVFCRNSGHQRHWYNGWRDEMTQWNEYFAG